MPKVMHNDIQFDSHLEVSYYQHLYENGYTLIVPSKVCFVSSKSGYFYYHAKIPIQLAGRKYTPDFIVFKENVIEIIETKGWNQFSYMADNMVHNQMAQMTKQALRSWLHANNLITKHDLFNVNVVYKKIKFLKAHGWVDFKWKNPNTLANKRKIKLDQQKADHKNDKAYFRQQVRELKLVIKKKDIEIRKLQKKLK